MTELPSYDEDARVTRCERCGKFRKARDCQYIWHGDPTDYNSGEVMECRWCMSPSDRRRMEENQ